MIKIYYYLFQSNYVVFVNGSYRPDSISLSYRKQSITNAKMSIRQQKKSIKSIVTSNSIINTLVYIYGESTLCPVGLFDGVFILAECSRKDNT